MLGPKCKVCGREMELRKGEHYRNTTKGRKLYRNVRQYSCPIGCSGAYFDFNRAKPMDKAPKLFGFIPLPSREVNLVDPLLIGGITFFYIMIVAGILATGGSALIRLLAIAVITAFAVLLYVFMQGGEGNEDESVNSNGNINANGDATGPVV